MRRTLDTIYAVAGWAAAACLVAIFALVSVQILARLLDGAMRLAGQRAVGLLVPSIAEICGFLLAAASFLALAKTLTAGNHIRIGMLVEHLPAGPRRWVEAVVGLAAFALAVHFTVALGRLTLKSASFGDVSYGMIPVPLALPQGMMTLGLAILAVAVLDVTVTAFRDRKFLESGET
ncbi:MAG: TRAP transporter small permease [Rhizobiaceae bacterium]|nr:TRAP transporter small permease [Rhizobiaceae bacterium]MCV0406547.1 TRAP transporter small permease [Rhizobiaceae bacterium]